MLGKQITPPFSKKGVPGHKNSIVKRGGSAGGDPKDVQKPHPLVPEKRLTGPKGGKRRTRLT